MDKANIFVVDGCAYDLSEWIAKHPGGSVWFRRSGSRDISIAIHAYHKDSKRLLRILKKYKVDIDPKDVLSPVLGNIPRFILPDDFDAARDVPQYDWSKESSFLSKLRPFLDTPQMKKKVKRANILFDVVGGLILLSHILMMFIGISLNILPFWGYVLFFVVTRTALASVGHYHCHRKKNGTSDWGDSLFDMQYVGATIILYDGHVLLHHLYTNSPADVKRTVFTGMLGLPRLYRVPIYTIQKFGQFLTGYFIRWITTYTDNVSEKAKIPIKKEALLFLTRSLLLAEFIYCLVSGYILLWTIQFFVTVWYNLFLIVSSHDFEESETSADLSPGQDWGEFQVINSFDMSVVGNRYIDCFLTAGLGTHRTHHVLPYQRSGFANIVSDPIVKKVAEESGIEWQKPRNFIFNRLPKLFKFYMFAPVKGKETDGFFREHFSFSAVQTCLKSAYLGFQGEGSL